MVVHESDDWLKTGNTPFIFFLFQEYICRAKIEKFREEADKVRTCIEQM